MRPKKIEDMVGQRHIIGKGKVLNKIIDEKDKLIVKLLSKKR